MSLLKTLGLLTVDINDRNETNDHFTCKFSPYEDARYIDSIYNRSVVSLSLKRESLGVEFCRGTSGNTYMHGNWIVFSNRRRRPRMDPHSFLNLTENA